MFDKNEFKDSFKIWMQSHANSSVEEAQEFCRSMIPPTVILQNYWLIEQSVQWFSWVQSRKTAEDSADLALESAEERIVC